MKPAAEKLAVIAGVNLKEYGMAMLKAGADLGDLTPAQIAKTDSKPFSFGKYKAIVAQISVMDTADILAKKAELVAAMQELCQNEGYDMSLLMVTDIMEESTELVFVGEPKQLIADADWGELDYFILDTPPGTSDIHLTLLQTLAITGAVIVSTPQQVALADARKGIDMYQNDKVNVPILGLIENMAYFTPAELPENKYYIFGKEGCKNLAKEMNVPLLAQIPIVQSICEGGDDGAPAATKVDSITGQAFLSLAQSIVTVVNRRNAEKAPTKIVSTHK